MMFEPFENIFKDSTSSFTKVKKEDYRTTGKYPIIDQGQSFIGGYTDDEKLIVNGNLPAIIFGDHTKIFKYVDFPFTIGADGVKVLKLKNEKDNALFYYFFLKSIKIVDKGYSRHFKYLKEKKLPSPNYADQLHIANLLSKAENLISQRKESLRLLDEFLKSTFLEMFGDAVKNEKKWSKSELKNYAKVRIGPFGSLLHKEDYVQNGVPLVNPSHIGEGKIFIDPELTISKAKMKELSAYIMREGDVVLGRRGEIGRCAVVTKNEEGYLCGTGSIYIRPTEELNPIFLYNIISSVSMRKVLENSAKGITMKNLNSGIIENLKIPVPPMKIQTQFAQTVEKAEVLKIQYRESLEELENLYGSLSQRAFKGELGLKEKEEV
jgi:type I restriction enzyme S subunit